MIKISDTEYFSNDKTIRFLNMDCNEFMAGCKENEFDLIHNDPPYSISVNMNAGRKKDTKSKKREVKKWDNELPSEFHFEECFRVSKNQIIWGANHMIDKIKKNSQGWIVWDKCVAAGCSFSDCELAWTSFNQSLKKIVSAWSGFIGYEGEKFHPTTKPIAMYEKVIELYTKPTDTILDCFGCSMSNAIACHMKRRKLTIIELDVDYFKSALNRFEIYERQVEDIKEFGYAKTKINAQNPVLF